MGLDWMRKGGTGRAQEAAGSRAASVVFLISAPTTALRVSRLPDVVGCGAEKTVLPA